MARPKKKTEEIQPVPAIVANPAIIDCEADSQPEVAKSFPALKSGKCDLSEKLKEVASALEDRLKGSSSLHLQVALKGARSALDAIAFENKKNQLSGN